MKRPSPLAWGLGALALVLIVAIAHHTIALFALQRVLSLASGATVRFADMELGASHATLFGVHATKDGDPLFDAERIDVAYDLHQLLPGGTRRYGLTSVLAEHPVFSLVRRRDGRYNLAGFGGGGGHATPASTTPAVPLRFVANVHDGAIRLIDVAPLEPDLATQSIEQIDAVARVDSAERTTVTLEAVLMGRQTQDAPLRAYPIAVRSTTDVARGYTSTRTRAASIPLRGILNFLVHSPFARFDDGVVNDVDVLAYGLARSPGGPLALELGGGADLAATRVAVQVLNRPIRNVRGHLALFGDGVTTDRLDGDAAGTPLQVRGGVYDFANPQFRLAIGGNADLTRLKTLFAFLDPQPVRGEMHLETLITGAVTDPLIRTALSSDRLWYGTIPLDRLHGIVDYDHGGVTFTGVHAGFGPLRAATSGNVDVTRPDAVIDAYVDITGPAAQVPYAQAIARDAQIDASAVVNGTGSGGFRAAGTMVAAGPQTRGSGFVAVDERGRGEFGPFTFERSDGSSLSGAMRLERPGDVSAAWLAARNYRLDVPRRLATLPGVDIPPFPQVGGLIDADVVAGGPPSEFTVAGHIHARRASYATYALGEADLGLAGTLADLRLQNVRVDGPVGHFRGGGATADGLFALGGRYVGSLQALAPFTGDIGARGPVDAPVLALVDGAGITVQTADAAMAGASIHGVPIDRAAGTLRIDAAGVRIVAANADVLGRPAVAASRGAAVAVSAIGIPATALAAAGVPLEAGRVSVFGLAGFRGPTFAGNVDVVRGRTQGGFPVGGWAALRIAGPSLTVRDGVAAIGVTYTGLSGRLDLAGGPRYALIASVPLGDVGSLVDDLRLPAPTAAGSFTARLRIAGSGASPVITGAVTLPEGSYNGLGFANASGRVAILADPALRVRIDDGDVRVGSTRLHFSAAAGGGTLALDAASPAADLADFDGYFDESDFLDGRGSFAFAFVDDGRSVRTYGRIALDQTRARRFPLGSVRALWGMRRGLIAGSFTTDAPSGSLSASGTIASAAGDPLAAFAAARYDGNVRGGAIDLGTWLPALGLPYPILGRLSGGGHVQGIFPRIAVGGSASIAGGQIGAYPIGTASLTTAVLGDRVGITDGIVDLGFVRFTSSGTVGLGPHDPLSLHVHAAVADVAEAARRLERNPPDVAGSLEADALINGSYAAPRIATGIDIENGRYGAFAVQHIIADFETDLHTTRLDSAEVAFAHGTADVAGSLPFSLSPLGPAPATTALSLTADARDVDLSLLAPLVPGKGTRLGGTLNGRLGLQGTVGSPRIFGSATLSDGSYVSDLETSPIHALDAGIEFDGTSVALRSLHGNVGSGTVDASGQIDLPIADAPASGYSVDLAAAGAQLDLPAYGSGSLDARAQFVSGARIPTLSGDVTLYDTTIPFATIVRAASPGDGGAAGLPFNVGLDLTAVAGKNVRIRSSIVDVGATGAVTLTGSLRDPHADGVIAASRGGQFSTYQRLFRIADATVTFNPAQGVIPDLDLRATAHVTNPDPDTTRNTIGSADITVTVRGPADSYVVNYSSQPAYSQAQIIALLAAIPILGAVNFNTPQPVGTLRGAPGESDVLLPPGVTPAETGVYTFSEEAFSLLSNQLTQRFLSPVENTVGGGLGLTDLEVSLDYGGRVGYVARKEISAKRQLAVTLGQVLSYPTRTQFGITAQPDAVTRASFSYFIQNGTPSYQNSIFGNTANVQVVNGIQPLSNRQGFTAVITRSYP